MAWRADFRHPCEDFAPFRPNTDPLTSPIPANGFGRLDVILESAHEAFISMDADGLVRAWNREAERTFGWSREAVIGRPLRETIIPPRFRARHDEGLRRFLETGDGPLLGKRIEISALHRNGHEFPVELTIAAVAQGDSWGFHAFVHDISDRYRAMELQARLASIVEHSVDAIISRSTDGRVLTWNPGAERLFGYAASEMIGETTDRLAPPGREDEIQMLIDRVVAGESITAFETQRRCKDGRLIDVSITISPIVDDAGQVRELSMISRDITTRKQGERALERAVRELEEMNELKSRFVAIASHELRTPLASIYGFATTLIARWESFDDDEKRSFLAMIEEQAARLKRIVDDVLVLSRVESRKFPAESHSVDVQRAAEAVVADLGVSGETTLALEPGTTACVEPDHLHRILLNLLANARAYGAPPYTVAGGPDGDAVLVSVADSGDGVSPEFVPRLFDPFTQAAGAPAGHGTGLGLAIVKGLAEAAGGRAWYEPNVPAGARFVVSLPRP
jgi:two-component system, sensor histidine kinase and response regulator